MVAAADASRRRIERDLHDGVQQQLVALCLEPAVRDDGAGGAEPGRGSGLIGLVDRVEAIGGKLDITSPPGESATMNVNCRSPGHAMEGVDRGSPGHDRSVCRPIEPALGRLPPGRARVTLPSAVAA